MERDSWQHHYFLCVCVGPTCIYDDSHGLLRVTDGAAAQQQVFFVKCISSPTSMDSVEAENDFQYRTEVLSNKGEMTIIMSLHCASRGGVSLYSGSLKTTSVYSAEHLNRSCSQASCSFLSPEPLSQHKIPLI